MPRTILRLSMLALAVACAPAPARAQDQPTVFVHGFNSDGGTWQAAAARLQTRLAIAPQTPSINWRNDFPSQASSLQSQLASLPGSPVAVAHSNGGLASRQWSRIRSLGGLVTIGTPNQGAPIASNLLRWAAFNDDLYYALSDLYDAFTYSVVDWSSVYEVVKDALKFISALSVSSVLDLAEVIGLRIGMPVLPQEVVGSPFLSDLNSDANLNREASEIPSRVGIISGDASYYYAGVFRLISPDNADTIANVMYYTIDFLEYWAYWILAHADIDDFDAQDIADAMFRVADWLRSVDRIWCRVISSPTMSSCWPSDGFIPVWSQLYPGAVEIDFVGGPTHTQETKYSDEAIYSALTTYVHVPPRGSGGTGGTGGTGGGTGGGGGGGGGGGVASGDTMYAGQLLNSLTSADGRFTFVYQGDGNLVLYLQGGVPLWASGTSGAGQALLQGDGNFVIYNGAGTPVWASNTAGNTDDRLTVQSDGNVVIYSSGGSALWSTGTAGAGGSGGTPDPCATPDGHNHSGSCGSADSCGHVFGSDTDCGCPNAPIVYDTCTHTVCDTGQNWVEDFCTATNHICDTGWTWVDQYCQGSNWVCDTGSQWVDQYCQGSNWVCDTGYTCWETCDEWGNCWTDCGEYQYNCREEPYTYVCGGYWSSYEYNCRTETYSYVCGGSWQSYEYNCRDEPYTYSCGGHWETYEFNCREESYECNPHQCGR